MRYLISRCLFFIVLHAFKYNRYHTNTLGALSLSASHWIKLNYIVFFLLDILDLKQYLCLAYTCTFWIKSKIYIAQDNAYDRRERLSASSPTTMYISKKTRTRVYAAISVIVFMLNYDGNRSFEIFVPNSVYAIRTRLRDIGRFPLEGEKG